MCFHYVLSESEYIISTLVISVHSITTDHSIEFIVNIMLKYRITVYRATLIEWIIGIHSIVLNRNVALIHVLIILIL